MSGTIIIDGKPPTITQQMKRLRIVKGMPMFYHSKEYKAQEKRVIALLSECAPNEPICGPVWLNIDYYFAPRKADERLFLMRTVMVPKHTRPDIDNMVKFMLDCITKAGFWLDDSQVSCLRVTKRWAITARTIINIGEDRAE